MKEIEPTKWKGRGHPTNNPCISGEVLAFEDNDTNDSIETQENGANTIAHHLATCLLLTNLDPHRRHHGAHRKEKHVA